MANNPHQKRIGQMADEIRELRTSLRNATDYAESCNRRVARMRAVVCRRRRVCVSAIVGARVLAVILTIVVATVVALAFISALMEQA